MDGINRLPYALEADGLHDGPTLAAPRSTGSERWDTLLAVAVRYRLHQMGIDECPDWTLKEPLSKFWWPVRITPSKEYNDMAHTPPELWRVGIFMDENGFTTA